MKTYVKLTFIAVLMGHAGLAAADLSRGPDPYADGYGFDKPEEAVWGGWARGSAGSLYAEWDVFNDASHGTAADRTAAPDVGSANTTEAYLSWNEGTIVAGSGNLYRHRAAQHFVAYVEGQPVSSPVRAVLQFETTGWELDYTTIALNGETPTFQGVTFNDTVATNFGNASIVHYLAYWDLEQGFESYSFSFGSELGHVSLAQVAVDIAAVPVPAAVWLMGSALLGLAGWRRRQYSTAIVG